jgi:hypothetical protein
VRFIAEREIRFWPDGAKRSKKITVRLSEPESPDGGKNWYVTYEILGPNPSDRIKQSTGGVDAVQALVGALQLIPVELQSVAVLRRGKMTFLNEAELGFAPGPIKVK